jgi:hypothetical protein
MRTFESFVALWLLVVVPGGLIAAIIWNAVEVRRFRLALDGMDVTRVVAAAECVVSVAPTMIRGLEAFQRHQANLRKNAN